jgi:hypothetical protein
MPDRTGDESAPPAATPRNLPELTTYAAEHGWALVDDPPILPESEWMGGPRGLPGWRLTFVKGEQGIGAQWFGGRSRHDAGRKLLRALQAWDAEHE